MNAFSSRLLAWYQQNARVFPWRFPTGSAIDPYAVWVSEIMLQQTRTAAVKPYYERWMARFPTLTSLAESNLQDVLKLWEGLGYYSRARNMHRSAQMIVNELGSVFPNTRRALLHLPGVGAYTAAAIASIAFNKDEYVIDGNVRRVLARVFDVPHPLGSQAAERSFNELGLAHLPPGRAGEYNQALMELGAVVCLPKAPRCALCPLQETCVSFLHNLQEQRPVRRQKTPLPHHLVVAGVIQRQGKVLIGRRAENGLLGGLWEFPGGKLNAGEDFPGALQRELAEELGVDVVIGERLGIYRHAFTHFRITLHAFACVLANTTQPSAREHTSLVWAAPAELQGYPMGKVDRQISKDILACLAR